MRKKLLFGTIVFSFFSFFGYINSDAVFYKKIIRLNALNTPDDIFVFLKLNTHNRYRDSLMRYPTTSGIPVRDMIECNRGFWCDEGAIAMSKFLDYLPKSYSWRLVDIYGTDDISHHTVIQVFYNEKWITYDTFFKTDNLPPEKTVQYPVPYVKYRNWNLSTKLYHFIIEHNSAIKYITLKIRGIY